MASSRTGERESAEERSSSDDAGIFEGIDPQQFVVLSTYSRAKFNRFSEGITPPEEFYDDFFRYIRQQQRQSDERYARFAVRKERTRRILTGILSAVVPDSPRRA